MATPFECAVCKVRLEDLAGVWVHASGDSAHDSWLDSDHEGKAGITEQVVTVQFLVSAEHLKDMPAADELLTALVDALPEEWFARDMGDMWWLSDSRVIHESHLQPHGHFEAIWRNTRRAKRGADALVRD